MKEKWVIYGSWLLELTDREKQWQLLIDPLVDRYTVANNGLSKLSSFWISDSLEEPIKNSVTASRLITTGPHKLHVLESPSEELAELADVYLIVESTITCNEGLKNGQMYLLDLMEYDNIIVNTLLLQSLMTVEKLKS